MTKKCIAIGALAFTLIVCTGPLFAQLKIDGVNYYNTAAHADKLRKKTSFKKDEGFVGVTSVEVVNYSGTPDIVTGAPFFVRVNGEKQPANYSAANALTREPPAVYIDRTMDGKRLASKKIVHIPFFGEKPNGKDQIEAIITGMLQRVDIIYDWGTAGSQAYYFTIQPNSEVGVELVSYFYLLPDGNSVTMLQPSL